MRRLTRAITEIESFKTAILDARKGWPTPSEVYTIGLLNTALSVLEQVKVISPLATKRAKVEPKVDRVSEMISQVNEEIRDDAADDSDGGC